MSPKEKIFLSYIKEMQASGIKEFTISEIAQKYYNAGVGPMPPYWRQATVATINRMINSDMINVVKDKGFRKGPGSTGKYIIM